ncbi:zf-HC2 domain-containing protein [Actinophytocola sp.]|uniref:zf-HC2 domain-containing protein n=1 Tax=Actinophytocola sp. TaxID=1872138 RepID=UPI003D6A0665
MPTPDHIDVGAYVLGILDPPEQAAFAKHFANCARCRAEYRELADLPRLLEQIKPEITPAPSAQALDGALAEIAATRRGRRRNLWLAAAAAGVLVVSLPIAVWQSTGGDRNTTPQAAPTVTKSVDQGSGEKQSAQSEQSTAVAGARTLQGTDRATSATAFLTLDGDSSATTVDLQLFAVPGPAEGKLYAVTSGGDRQLVMRWEMGVDQPSTKARGTVDIPILEIEQFELRQTEGPVKIDIAT